MKINIIGNFQKNTGLALDSGILRGIITAVLGESTTFMRVHYLQPQCGEADYNIFLEVINPSLFPYANKNIWIPNPEWTYKTWIPYIFMVDEIWVKTKEAEKIFKKYSSNVKNIGWSSIGKAFSEKKNYHKAIVPVGKNIYRFPKPIFQAYMRIKTEDEELYKKLPSLNVVYSPDHINMKCPEEILDKVKLIDRVLTDNEYNDLVDECGLCICTSLSEGFCHAVNECMSSGCYPILSKIPAFTKSLLPKTEETERFYIEVGEPVEQPNCISYLYDSNVNSLMEKLKLYVDTSFQDKKLVSKEMRKFYEMRHDAWVAKMNMFLYDTLVEPEKPYDLRNVLPKEEDLPDVSVVCITKDRRPFMPLLKYCYMIQSYPEDKLELVIVDDGEDSIEDTLIGVPNVKYVRCESKMTISQKRNLGVENAMYDIIAMMDDDDIYPNNSVLHRTAMLLKEPQKECAFCTTIPCYDITKFASFMNVPPMTLHMSERVSEASLVFTKKFWEERKFDDETHIAEGNAFIRDREHMCRELSPQEVIVSLVHPKNTSARRIPANLESNGCHWGFNENLFALVTQIGQELNKKDHDGACENDA